MQAGAIDDGVRRAHSMRERRARNTPRHLGRSGRRRPTL
jgi:hypothetical protein